MQKYSTQFERIKVGKRFYKNGYIYKKRSTRTAEIVNPENVGTWFYFSKDDQVIITKDMV